MLAQVTKLSRNPPDDEALTHAETVECLGQHLSPPARPS
jgi:hypothetical protein